MSLAPMSFKDYVWPYNPESVKIERARNTALFKIPQGTGTVQDAGMAARRVSGSGRFAGDGCAEEFAKLAAAFSSAGGGTLRLPGTAPFQAVFESLTMKGPAGADCVGYEFVFWEDASAAPEDDVPAGAYVCSGGETLWDVANRSGTDVDALLALNPQIEWPNALETGERVAVA